MQLECWWGFRSLLTNIGLVTAASVKPVCVKLIISWFFELRISNIRKFSLKNYHKVMNDSVLPSPSHLWDEDEMNFNWISTNESSWKETTDQSKACKLQHFLCTSLVKERKWYLEVNRKVQQIQTNFFMDKICCKQHKWRIFK